VKRLSASARLLICIDRACNLIADDGADEVRIECTANGGVGTLTSLVITGEAGEGAMVDVDGETSEG
jgi:hypothetical protein